MTWILFALRNWRIVLIIGLAGCLAVGGWRLYQAGVASEFSRNQIAALESRNEILALDARVQKSADAVQEKAAADLESKLVLQGMQLKEYENELKKKPNSNCAIDLDDLNRLRGF
jgi:hypothetical protein